MSESPPLYTASCGCVFQSRLGVLEGVRGCAGHGAYTLLSRLDLEHMTEDERAAMFALEEARQSLANAQLQIRRRAHARIRGGAAAEQSPQEGGHHGIEPLE